MHNSLQGHPYVGPSYDLQFWASVANLQAAQLLPMRLTKCAPCRVMAHLLTARFPLAASPDPEAQPKRFKGHTAIPPPDPEARAVLLRRDFHVGLLVAAMDVVAAIAAEVRVLACVCVGGGAFEACMVLLQRDIYVGLAAGAWVLGAWMLRRSNGWAGWGTAGKPGPAYAPSSLAAAAANGSVPMETLKQPCTQDGGKPLPWAMVAAEQQHCAVSVWKGMRCAGVGMKHCCSQATPAIYAPCGLQCCQAMIAH